MLYYMTLNLLRYLGILLWVIRTVTPRTNRALGTAAVIFLAETQPTNNRVLQIRLILSLSQEGALLNSLIIERLAIFSNQNWKRQFQSPFISPRFIKNYIL